MYGLDAFHTDDPERPIYGYIDIGGRNDDLRGPMSLDMYGQVRVEFKDSVRDRTTVSFGDSLGEAYIPAPARRLHADAIVKSSKQDIDRPWRTAEYVEAQMHGGVTADDIARVVFPIGTPDMAYPPPSKDILDRLDPLGIPVVGTEGRPIPNAEIPGQGKLDGMSLAADAGVVYRDEAGATITYTGDDDQGRPLGYITRDGVEYPENLIIVLTAHGGVWEPVTPDRR